MSKSTKTKWETLVDEVREADAAYDAANDAACKAVKQLLHGMHVEWLHGDHVRSGTVIMVAGASYNHLVVHVESDTSGKTLRPDVHAILNYMWGI